jgi:hypothetical protein
MFISVVRDCFALLRRARNEDAVNVHSCCEGLLRPT